MSLTSPNAMLSALKASSAFAGEVSTDVAARLVMATDNSIYRQVPAAVVYPKDAQSLKTLIDLSHEHGVALTARGGGTGTNGQALNESVVIDVSRHMTRILSFDADSETVVVQPGVVLDQLNRFLGERGYFFPPTVSTSSRATLGGMFATDASGAGSRVYGKTSDYVRQVKVLLADGEEVCFGADADEQSGVVDAPEQMLAQKLGPRLAEHAEEIQARFPQMNRGLTGYNLLDALVPDSQVNFIKLLAGSEGTLGVTTELSLKVCRKPALRALAVIAYPDCLTALSHIPTLLSVDPVAIEFIDDRIVALAREQADWSEVEAVLGPLGRGSGFLYVEFSGESTVALDAAAQSLEACLDSDDGGNLGVIQTRDAQQIAALFEMRKRSVGLLAAAKGRRVGVPFVEDAAVPPENLVDFVREFRGVLDGHGLEYGMFGHADVGCLHVRPMLDMRSPSDRSLIREISEQVVALTQRHGGLIWGEHGKGVRGEFLERYVGKRLYALMREIKTAFDPRNRLNPGKLATPLGSGADVTRIDEFPMRGVVDQDIDGKAFAAFDKSLACNGNGACFHWSAQEAMCPSYKVTRDRVQAPKGRATLFREWSRAESSGDDGGEREALAAALFTSLETCLSCHSCSNQCPVQVDIPTMRSAFLARYFSEHPRPLRDRLLRHLEAFSLKSRHFPRLLNTLSGVGLTETVLRRFLGLTDVPRLPGTTAERVFREEGVEILRVSQLAASPVSGDEGICLVPDSFVGVYETDVLRAYIRVLHALGFKVFSLPLTANGKLLQLRGYLDDYQRIESACMAELSRVARWGLPLLGLEPAVVAMMQRDYPWPDSEEPVRVIGLDEFLARHLDRLPSLEPQAGSCSLFPHCTEKTADPQVPRRWKAIFEAMGQTLETPSTGCCGMSGLFGHEVEHQTISRQLFELSWQTPLAASTVPLVTGFSCRSQARRFSDSRPRHPAEQLADWLDTR